MIGAPIGWPIGAGALDTSDELLANDVESASEVTSPAIGQVHALSAADVESASEVSAPVLWNSALPVTSGLVVHLDADAITGLNDGDAVSSWTDGSPEGNNAAQATGSLQPLYKTGILNGLPVVRFDGADDRLVITDDDSLDHASLSVFVVWVLRGNSTGTDFARIVSKGQSQTANGAWGIQCKDVTDPDDLGLRFISGFTAHDIRNSALSSGYNDGAGHIATFVHNETNGNGLFRLDQVEEATLDLADGVGIKTTADDLQIGNGNSERPFNGDIAEVILYNRALTTQEISDVEGYLAAKWFATVHALTANDVESASEVSAPAVGQTHALTANDAESASELSAPALGQEHGLAASDVESASEVTAPSVSQVHGLAAEDVESASEVTAPSVGQAHGLAANDVESASEVTAPTVGQTHALTANDVESASELSAPVLAVEGEDALLAEDVESASEVTSPAVGQVHALTATDVESASELSLPVLAEASDEVGESIEPGKPPSWAFNPQGGGGAPPVYVEWGDTRAAERRRRQEARKQRKQVATVQQAARPVRTKVPPRLLPPEYEPSPTELELLRSAWHARATLIETAYAREVAEELQALRESVEQFSVQQAQEFVDLLSQVRVELLEQARIAAEIAQQEEDDDMIALLLAA